VRPDLEKLCGIVLALHRQQAGMSQAQLAARLRIPQSVVCRIERGQLPLRLSRLDALARALDTTAGAIVAAAERAGR